MSIDANYILLYSLQQYFVDKTTGTALANGKLYFYKDNARTTLLKTVYKYDSVNGYTALSNPVPLSGVGTPVDDDGNDIAIYVFPYTDSTASVIDLYYIVCKDSGGLTQFTREAIPNIESNTDSDDTNLINYIPNGQFLLHNNIPATGTTVAGEITTSITELAQGGWTWERGVSSSSTDVISFERYASYTTTPTGNPRYAIRIKTTADSTARGLRIKFRDVNKFSGSQNYTFSFNGLSNTGSPLTGVDIRLIKNFGTGGDSTTTSTKATVTIPNEDVSIINATINFGDNAGKIIGTENDDYLQLEISIPNASIADITLTDFVLTPGMISVAQFPVTTTAKFVADSLAGWAPVPDYDGQNLYLPLVLTPSGLAFSDADIGKIFAGMYTTARTGELLCDGSKYETESFSSDGIPYSRLQAKWFSTPNLEPIFGTGQDYITGNYTNLAAGVSTLRVAVNKLGSSTFSAGTSGFIIASICTGLDTGMKGYLETGGIIAVATAQGAGTVVDGSVSTSATFTVLKNRLGAGTTPQAYFSFDMHTSSSGIPAAGSYFKFTNPTGNFYMWFTVDGVGSDPAVGGYTPIHVSLLSTYSINEIPRIIRQAISGYQIALITFPAASSITAGTYFSVTTPTPTTYYIWYRKDGIGNDPFPGISNSLKIRVDVLTGDTAPTVTTKTLTAINSKYFAVPDLRGMFLRGADTTSLIDIDSGSRMSVAEFLPEGLIGTTELDQFFQHKHPGSTATVYGDGGVSQTIGLGDAGAFSMSPLNIAQDGGTETRPYNAYVNYFVKY